MDRKNFLTDPGGLSLTTREANAADKKLYRELTENSAAPSLQDGGSLKALAHTTLIRESDLPFVGFGDKATGQLLLVDLATGLWIVRLKFEAGAKVGTHYQTGSVFAVTFSGMWYYKEHPRDKNIKGSFLYEPAHSLHTLMVPETNEEITDVWFAVLELI